MYTVKYIKIIICLFTFFLYCTFDEVSNQPLTMNRIDESGDTVLVWPSLTFVFSVPVQDSSVALKMIPYPGTVYNSNLNETKDTLILIVSGSLIGNTKYLITLENQITATNGSVLYPEDVSVEITTLSKEHEPNNNLVNIDTLNAVCCGTISPTNDTDYFYMNNSTATSFYQKCHTSNSGYFITDSSGKTIVLDDGFDEIKTFTITDTVTMPLFVGIFSVYDNDARYEIRLE